MGRESECECECSGTRGRVKALLEPPDLILRGEIRRRIPFAGLTQIRADGECLHFNAGGETFTLALGNAMAQKWVKALTTAPPSLAKKLGISADTAVRVIGAVDDEALQAALTSAGSVVDKNPDLILARVNTAAELAGALRATAKQLAGRVPIWLIYPKGHGHGLTENEVRSTALAAGIVDTKVCAVSATLTALRFVKRRDA